MAYGSFSITSETMPGRARLMKFAVTELACVCSATTLVLALHWQQVTMYPNPVVPVEKFPLAMALTFLDATACRSGMQAEAVRLKGSVSA